MRKNTSNIITSLAARTLPLVAILALGCAAGASSEEKATKSTKVVKDGSGSQTITIDGKKPSAIVIKKIEADSEDGPSQRNESTWLGVATDEATEVLIAQMGLDPGVGLVVTYVATDSPAAKAGLQKNDVLISFDGQSLVHPSQLRKLVQVRKDGDEAKLTYYRSGKKSSTTATLGKSAGKLGMLDGEIELPDGNLFRFNHQLKNLGNLGNLNGSHAFHWQMDDLHDSLNHLKHNLSGLGVDQKQLQEEINRSMQSARETMRDAMRQSAKAVTLSGANAAALADLDREGVEVSDDATVTVHSAGSAVKTTVRTDDTATYVIIADPEKHLTVHGKDGTLLFDGEIETPEQQAKVPKDIWEKIQPIIKKTSGDKSGDTLPGTDSADTGR